MDDAIVHACGDRSELLNEGPVYTVRQWRENLRLCVQFKGTCDREGAKWLCFSELDEAPPEKRRGLLHHVLQRRLEDWAQVVERVYLRVIRGVAEPQKFVDCSAVLREPDDREPVLLLVAVRRPGRRLRNAQHILKHGGCFRQDAPPYPEVDIVGSAEDGVCSGFVERRACVCGRVSC